MIVLKEIATAQELKFIPRVYAADKVVLIEEQTNIPVEINAAFVKESYYLVANIIFNLKQDRYYSLKVYNGSDIVYRDKIFCTNQTPISYSINNGKYVSQPSDNEYIVI